MNYTEQEVAEMSVASDGSCDDGCTSLVLFIILSIIIILFLTTITVPNLIVTIR